MARFFLPKKQLHDNHGTIDGQELNHLRRVLRLKPGDRITVFDETGWEHEAVIHSLATARGEIEIVRSYQAERESPLHVTLAVGLTKGEKIDFVVEKATELGVQTIIPFASTYAVPKLDERKIAGRTERWQKIALSATKQCGRARVPEVSALCTVQDLLARSWPDALKLIFWEKEVEQSLRQVQQKHVGAKAVLLMIGPEGGFSVEEAELARSHGFELVQLGRRILRAETAAVTALALAQYLWGDLA
ncbi:MAG: 16S rRNA (uracil(1498)-N(3))-methyltransferase [Candidatus Binatia bacterium]